MTAAPTAGATRIEALARRRAEATRRFFERDAERLAQLCHEMAERFARGGSLIAVGSAPAARSDVRHVAVEFVHPVIVGKRALPALGLSREGGPLAAQLELAARADDIVIAFGTDQGDDDACAALAIARNRGCLTIAFSEAGAAWEFDPPSDDPFIRQELVETLYHILWELVHVFFDHRGLLRGRDARPVHDVGASNFLYPFLSEQQDDLPAVLDDVRRSVLMKAEEITAVRTTTLREGSDTLQLAARAIRASSDHGGCLLAFGNGGSATDAIDLVADFLFPPHGWRSRRALDLTEDTAIITAIANDVGIDAIFSRQVIAHGRKGDIAVGLSTSGSSTNVIEALREARRRSLVTIALVGYDGGRIAAEQLADHVIITRSEHIPRIQEAQASACHILRELVELAATGTGDSLPEGDTDAAP